MKVIQADDFLCISKMAETKEENKQKEDEDIFMLRWMIRPCGVYNEEYSDCTSIKSRFHQYFVHGKTIDCNAWKTDYVNCTKWAEQDIKAYKELIASEQKRRADRLLPHFQNDTWKKRSSPPKEWNAPLPAWLEEENKVSFLALKAEELKNEGQNKPGERSLCVIS